MDINVAAEFFSLISRPAKIAEKLLSIHSWMAQLVVGYPLMLTYKQLDSFASLLKA